ncbi:MAG: DUF2306 domain-containing protein [Bacillus sp. (in: firmicutes)]
MDNQFFPIQKQQSLRKEPIKNTIHLLRFLIFPITKYKSHYNTSLVIHYQPSTFGFGFLSIFWLGTAGVALYQIKLRQIELHRKWMIRNYSLTFCGSNVESFVTSFHSTSRHRKLYNQLYHHIVVMLDPKPANSSILCKQTKEYCKESRKGGQSSS